MIDLLFKDLEGVSKELNQTEIGVLYQFIQKSKERILKGSMEVELEEPIYIDDVKVDKLHVFVDGSFDKEKGLCGSGMVFLKDLKDEECFDEYYFSTKDEHNQWNIQGECEATIGAVERALEMSCKEIVVYYDYQGLESWFDKSWKAKNPYTKGYVERMDKLSKKIKINMVKVKGHSKKDDVFKKWNDVADKLARESLGK